MADNNNIVIFDPEEFKKLYPQLAGVDDVVLENNFKIATLALNNSVNSAVKDLDERKTLLYLLTCHISELQQRGAFVVGVLSGATQGKVSTSYTLPMSLNWYNQTQCGMLFGHSRQSTEQAGVIMRLKVKLVTGNGTGTSCNWKRSCET